MQKVINRLFLPSFAGYQKRSFKRDFLAALVVTAIAIPESLGFAAIVGLPIQTGLYCALFAPIVFAIFTSSRHLVIGADSATAALVASGAATVAAASSAEFAGAVALLGVLTGALLLAMSALRFGFLADFISRPVLVGFMAGVGVQLLIGKLPEMLAIEASGSLLQKMQYMVMNLHELHWPTALLALSVFLIVIVAGKYKLPGALIGLAVATLVTQIFGLSAYGIEQVGSIAAGLPQFALPQLTIPEVALMFTSAAAIALVILAQSSAVIRSFASKYDEPVRINKDLMALGLANIASALTQGFAVNGSPPRSSAGEMAGGRSQMVNVFMALMIGAILLFASGLLATIPQAALSAVVCAIGLHLIKIEQLKDIWRTHKAEFFIALLALLAVAFLGVQQGVILAVIGALIERLRREYRPADEILLRDGEIKSWAARRIEGSHKHTSRPDGMLIYYFDSDLFFENASYFTHRINRAIKGAKKPVTSVVLDAGAMSDIDYTGAAALRKLSEQLSEDGIRFAIGHVSPGLYRLFGTYSITELIGPANIYASLREAVRSQPSSKRSVHAMVTRLELSLRSYVVIGGGVLEALGIRSTADVDLVVSNNAYRDLHARGWHEYVQDDGKRVLSHRGYKIMTSYMGRDLKRLQRNSFIHEGIRFMGLDDLIKSKQALDRKKDHQDIALIRAYQKKHRLGRELARTATKQKRP